MSVLAATWSRSEPGNYLETVAELDELKLKSESVLVCARVRDWTLTLSCVTVARFPEETPTIARELAGRQGFETREAGFFKSLTARVLWSQVVQQERVSTSTCPSGLSAITHESSPFVETLWRRRPRAPSLARCA